MWDQELQDFGCFASHSVSPVQDKIVLPSHADVLSEQQVLPRQLRERAVLNVHNPCLTQFIPGSRCFKPHARMVKIGVSAQL